MFQNFNVKRKRKEERESKERRGREKENDFEIFSNIQRHTLISNIDRTFMGI